LSTVLQIPLQVHDFGLQSRDLLPYRFALILGYSGWYPGQLENEIEENSWLVAPVESSIVFDTPFEERWTAALQTIGVDPVHFGIIMIANLGLGLCTPPVGSALFVGCAIGETRIEEVTRSVWPFYIAMFAVILLITYVPFISMGLVRAYLGG